ncbi:alpha-amylase 4N-like [Topomyia yanbarensis]|uniref:alpha-amylase 4N-like n=1 Tax=Topomyia yanbarensis TaxID=2498891 RepID=UPI00273CC374|nr:alpha-amylase 4N-like [Topomyia yanbarensis]
MTNRAQFDPHFADATGSRSAIVQLFEWTFADIESECLLYLGPNRFGAVQVSPVNEVRILPDRPWRERYEPISYKIFGRSGNEMQFRSMVKTCNEAGVRIYVEVVLNNMAGGSGSVAGTAGSVAYPVNKDYPDAPYGAGDFNDACIILPGSEPHEVRNCQVNDMPDLNQGLARVRQRITDFLNKLIAAGVAGFYVHAAKNMWPHDLKAIYSKLENLSISAGFPPESKPFIYQDVLDLSSEGTFRNDYLVLGMVTEYRFAYDIGAIMFKQKPFHLMVNLGTRLGFIPREKSIIFIDDQVLQRKHKVEDFPKIVTFNHSRLYRIALVFMLGHRYGTPRIMSSYYFSYSDEEPPSTTIGTILPVLLDEDDQCTGTWICEHRWKVVTSMMRFRIEVADQPVISWVDNGQNQLAFCRGKVGFIAINAEISLSMKANLYTCLEAGIYCDIISGKANGEECSGLAVAVDDDGRAEIFISSEAEDPFIVLLASEKV